MITVNHNNIVVSQYYLFKILCHCFPQFSSSVLSYFSILCILNIYNMGANVSYIYHKYSHEAWLLTSSHCQSSSYRGFVGEVLLQTLESPANISEQLQQGEEGHWMLNLILTQCYFSLDIKGSLFYFSSEFVKEMHSYKVLSNFFLNVVEYSLSGS